MGIIGLCAFTTSLLLMSAFVIGLYNNVKVIRKVMIVYGTFSQKLIYYYWIFLSSLTYCYYSNLLNEIFPLLGSVLGMVLFLLCGFVIQILLNKLFPDNKINKQEKNNAFISSFVCVAIVAFIESVRLGNDKNFLLLSGTSLGIVFGQYFNMDMYIDAGSFVEKVKSILKPPNVNIKRLLRKMFFWLIFGSGLYFCVFWPDILQQIGCGVANAAGMFVVGFLVWYYKFGTKGTGKIKRITDEK